MAVRSDWESIRAEYKAGTSQSDLARRYGLSRTAIIRVSAYMGGSLLDTFTFRVRQVVAHGQLEGKS